MSNDAYFAGEVTAGTPYFPIERQVVFCTFLPVKQAHSNTQRPLCVGSKVAGPGRSGGRKASPVASSDGRGPPRLARQSFASSCDRQSAMKSMPKLRENRKPYHFTWLSVRVYSCVLYVLADPGLLRDTVAFVACSDTGVRQVGGAQVDNGTS